MRILAIAAVAPSAGRGTEGRAREGSIRRHDPRRGCSSPQDRCAHLLTAAAEAYSSEAMESALHQRDAALEQAFAEGGKHVEKRLQARGNRAKKGEYLRELVNVVICDSVGKIIHGCDFKIGRSKMSLTTLMGFIKKSPLPHIDPDYFIDNTGTPFYIEDMMLKTQKPPMYYIIIPKVKRENFDIRKDPTYQGQTIIKFSGVPEKAKDEMTMVDELALRKYFLTAVLEVDPAQQPYVKAIKEAKETIAAVDKKIKGVSKLKFYEANGDEMSDERQEAEREALFSVYAEERMKSEKFLKSKETALQRQIDWRNTMGIEFVKISKDDNTSTCVWSVRLYGATDAEELEDLLTAKDDWAGLKLACQCDDPELPPWAGRGRVPDGTLFKAEPDYSLLLVNVAGARLARVADGVGRLQTIPRQDVPFYGERFEMYYGGWDLGEKNGRGMLVNDAGIFSGRFIDGHSDGPGRWDLADGTTIVGRFGVRQQYDYEDSASFHNPYKDGDPQGDIEVLFPDGALFKGAVVDGKVVGYGAYESGFGEIFLGNFSNGVLHGDNCYFRNVAGEKFRGRMFQGELNDFARYENARGDAYNGYFEYSLRHGRGEARYKRLGNYTGYHINGFRYGKGELEYGRRSKKDRQKAEQSSKAGEDLMASLREEGDGGKAPDPSAKSSATSDAEARMFEFVNCFQGFFFGDTIGTGGISTNITEHVSHCVSRRDLKKIFPIQEVISADKKNVQAVRRVVEKGNDMELFVRGEVRKKKMRIFNQHKHYTKKAMYGEEDGSVSIDELKGREIVRKERLLRLDLSKVTPHTAKIGRIKEIATASMPETYLGELFKSIHVDPDKGDVRRVKRLVPRIMAADFEEVKERQRYVKYDLIFAKAEEAFRKKKRALMGQSAVEE